MNRLLGKNCLIFSSHNILGFSLQNVLPAKGSGNFAFYVEFKKQKKLKILTGEVGSFDQQLHLFLIYEARNPHGKIADFYHKHFQKTKRLQQISKFIGFDIKVQKPFYDY